MKNLLFGAIFLAAGIGLSIWGHGMLAEAKASADWPTVQGTITLSDVSVQTSTSGTGSKKKTSTVYQPSVVYDYKVNGQGYTSHRITAGDFSSSSSKRAHRIAGKYPKGSTATVYYNPDEPYMSVLEPGATFTSYIPFASGLIFAGVGVLIMLGGIFGILKKIVRFAAS